MKPFHPFCCSSSAFQHFWHCLSQDKMSSKQKATLNGRGQIQALLQRQIFNAIDSGRGNGWELVEVRSSECSKKMLTEIRTGSHFHFQNLLRSKSGFNWLFSIYGYFLYAGQDAWFIHSKQNGMEINLKKLVAILQMLFLIYFENRYVQCILECLEMKNNNKFWSQN